MSEFATLLMRYVAAIAVACIVSAAAFGFLAFTVGMWAGVVGFLIVFLAVGFLGVFSGTFCLPRASRRSGSVVLLVLGLGFYAQMLIRLNITRGEDNSFPFVWLLPLVGGACGAVYFFRRLPPNQSPEPPADDAASSATRSTPRVGGGSLHGRWPL